MSLVTKKGLAPATIAVIILAVTSLITAAILIMRIQGAAMPSLL